MKNFFRQSSFSVLTLLVAVIFSFTVSGQEKRLSPALKSLVESERAFAKLCGEKGIRESFLTYFADDCISFAPDPGNAKERLRKRPPLTGPSPVTLNWGPIFADISQSGDFGYTTGPTSWVDNTPQKRPPFYGYYFSIWKKQSDGSWKVALDVGTEMPGPQAWTNQLVFKAAKQGTVKVPKGDISIENEISGLIRHDKEFLTASTSDGLVKAYLRYMYDETRLHRDRVFPLTNRDSIRVYFAKAKMTMTWEPTKADVAKSADLGYTMGSYEIKGEANKGEKGYYVRVWKRDGNGDWKIVFDTTHPVPPEPK